MSSIGPQLPPHLTKRKRSRDETDDASSDPPPSKSSRRPDNQDEIALEDSDSEDDGYGPGVAAPKATASIGPTLPSTTTRPSIGPTVPSTARAPSPPSKPSSPPPTRRVHGPAPPPAPLSQRPSSPPRASHRPTTTASASDSDSEDDYGPALPGTNTTSQTAQPPNPYPEAAPEPDIPRRDDWMLAPPSAEPGYRERDPTKIRNRKFASGATATTRPRDGMSGISSIWTETPEEKARRLADALLGRAGDGEQQQQQQRPRQSPAAGSSSGPAPRDDKIRAFTEQTRGKSLYEEHQTARKSGKSTASGAKKGGEVDDDEDDDPSKRAFDREKDMGLGMKISASKRKELLNRASDFGGRFSKGNYL